MFIFVIKNLRQHKNMTLEELSNKTGLSTSYLSKIENNKPTNCKLKTLEKISNALETNINDLFYSKLDIEDLKIKMNKIIDIYGLNSKEALEVSQIIDLLINIINKEK